MKLTRILWAALLALVVSGIPGLAAEPTDTASLTKRHAEAQITGVCELHNIRMSKADIPIHWGEAIAPGPHEPAYLFRLQHFPNAPEFVEGGCCLVPGKKTESVFLCPECRKAATQWRAKS